MCPSSLIDRRRRAWGPRYPRSSLLDGRGCGLFKGLVAGGGAHVVGAGLSPAAGWRAIALVRCDCSSLVTGRRLIPLTREYWEGRDASSRRSTKADKLRAAWSRRAEVGSRYARSSLLDRRAETRLRLDVPFLANRPAKAGVGGLDTLVPRYSTGGTRLGLDTLVPRYSTGEGGAGSRYACSSLLDRRERGGAVFHVKHQGAKSGERDVAEGGGGGSG